MAGKEQDELLSAIAALTAARTAPPVVAPTGPTVGERAQGLAATALSLPTKAASSALNIMPAVAQSQTGQNIRAFLGAGTDAAAAMTPESVKQADAAPILSRDAAGALQFDMPSAGTIGNVVLDSAAYVPALLAGARSLGGLRGGNGAVEAAALGGSNALTVAGDQQQSTLEEARADAAKRGLTGTAAELEAQQRAQAAFRLTAPVSFATGAAGLGAAAALGKGASSPLTGAVKGVLADAPFEGIEEFGQSVAGDVAMDRDPNYVEAAGAGVLGAIAGGLPGGVVGAIESRGERDVAPAQESNTSQPSAGEQQDRADAAQQQAAQAPVMPPAVPTAPAPVVVAGGVVVDPAAGALSRAVAQGVMEGTVDPNPAPVQIDTDTGEQIKPKAGEEAAGATADGATSQPGAPAAEQPQAPAGVDPVTGEDTRAPAEPAPRAPAAPEEVDAAVGMYRDAVMDATASRNLARSLGVSVQTVLDSKRRMRDAQKAENAKPKPAEAATEQGDVFATMPAANRARRARDNADELEVKQTGPRQFTLSPKSETPAATAATTKESTDEGQESVPAAEGQQEGSQQEARQHGAAVQGGRDEAREVTDADYDDSDEPLDTDITTSSGSPFTIRAAAESAARRTPNGRVVPVEGGFVVRTPKEGANGNQAAEPAADAGAVPAAQPAGTEAAADRVDPAAGGKLGQAGVGQGAAREVAAGVESVSGGSDDGRGVGNADAAGAAGVGRGGADAGVQARAAESAAGAAATAAGETAVDAGAVGRVADERASVSGVRPGVSRAGADGDAATNAPAAAGGGPRILRKPQAIERMRAAGLNQKQAEQAFSDIPAGSLRADRRATADIDKMIAERGNPAKRGKQTPFEQASAAPDSVITEALTRARNDLAEVRARIEFEGTDAGLADRERQLAKMVSELEAEQAQDQADSAADAAAAPAAAPAKKARTAKPGPVRRVYNPDGSYYTEPLTEPAKAAPKKNTVFTEDAANKARARLRKKLGQLNMLVDPEIIQDGITLAGYHIERGVRSFAAFARVMVEDLGESVRPYLRSWYMGVKYDPRAAGFDGMDDASTVEAANIDAITGATRTDAQRRALIDALPPDQRDAEIARLRQQVSELERTADIDKRTGIKGPGAFDRDVATAGGVAMIDLKLFKGYNTLLTDKGGDQVLAAFGEAMRDAGGERAYRRGGDEFAFLADTVADAQAMADALTARAAEIELHIRGGDGTNYTVLGVPYSAGVGTDEETAIAVRDASKGDYDRNALPGNVQPENAGRSEEPGSESEDRGSEAPAQEGVDDGRELRTGPADGRGPDALADAPAGDVPAVEDGGDAGSEAARGGDVDPADDADAGSGTGDDAGGSVAGSARRVPDSGPRKRARRAERVDPANTAESAQQPHGDRARNFVIDGEFALGEGGPKAKFAGNVAAIRLLKDLEAEGRNATPQEQAVLARYVGWGGIPQAFANPERGITKGWEKQAAELAELLDAAEIEAAARSTQDAHYTSREVVGGIYDGLRRLGFNGGLTLEPSMGTGNFVGLAPPELRGGMRWTGVELDSITGRIAQQLYPQANIIAARGFQDVNVPLNHFDAAIGNPPFGRTTLFDARNKDLDGFSIHNFFFAKSIKALKPGGVLSMVVSSAMMDKATGKQRRWLADHARLLGAIRLPNTAFKANAGTEVTTDIVFLQKLHPGETANADWTEIGSVPDPAGGPQIPINRYFVSNPDMMLGTMTREGKMRRAGEPTLSPIAGADLAEQLRQAVAKLPENVLSKPAPIEPGEAAPHMDVAAEVPVYGHFVDANNMVRQRLPDVLDERVSRAVDVAGADDARLRSLIDLRDRMKTLMRAEMADRPSKMLEAQRKALDAAYDKHVAAFGYLNSQKNVSIFRDDADAYRVRALEVGYERLEPEAAAIRGIAIPKGRKTVEQAKKADILQRRVFRPERAPTASTPQDALAVSLNTTGRIDLDMMAGLIGMPETQMLTELGSAVFLDPDAGYVTADQYLSGNVKAKLARARSAAEQDPALRANVEALEQVQPEDIGPGDIYVGLGGPWVPARYYAAFASEVLGLTNPRVNFVQVAQKFIVSAYGGTEKFGTSRLSAADIFTKALSREAITLYKRGPNDTQVVDGDATEAARAKADEIKEEFSAWVWKDAERRGTLTRIYNDTFNTDRTRTYDGSFLSFPGKVDDSIIKLRASQQNAIWRMVQDGTMLADHVVGAGKTYTAIAATMTKKRMGLASKPMLAVPNHLVQQWAGDFLRLYPAANILAVTKEDFSKDRRKLLFSRIATGDWDAVIVAHSQFSRIKPPVEFETQYMEQQLAEYDQAIEAMRNERDAGRTLKDLKQKRDQQKEKLKKRMEGIVRDDDTAFFDEMGIDDLTIDEAHEFKNLGFVTRKRNVAGMGSAANGGSKKAEDLFIKARYLQTMNKGRGLNFLTGTPVSNSLAEMFTMQKYLAYDTMKGRGIHLFDLWANTFAEESTEFELDSSGRGLKPKTVLKKFLNVPEMMSIYRSVADMVTLDDLKAQHREKEGKAWPVPKIRGGKPENVVVKPSPALLSFIEDDIIPRMRAIAGEEGKKPDPSVDNMLKVTNDARLAALDVRLRDPSAPDDPFSKTNVAVAKAKAIYDTWNERRGTQLIFCDLSTPKAAAAKEREALLDLMKRADEGDEDAQLELDKVSPDELLAVTQQFSVYDDVRAKLIASGIPANQIAFIHDAKTDLQKQAIFDKMNRGELRILMGSTSKMGAGMNAQKRMVALHHLDAPWRPSDLEQREGRIIRQGNEFYEADPDGFEVEILRYATERTYDSRMWQLIERKAAVVEQIRRSDSTVREVDDVIGQSASAAEMKAAATGNPLIIEQVELQATVKRLGGLKKSHDNRVYDAESAVARYRANSAPGGAYEKQAARAVAAAAHIEQYPKQPFAITVDGKTFDERQPGAMALAVKVVDAIKQSTTKGRRERSLGQYRGFELVHESVFGGDRITIVGPDPIDAAGDISNFMDEEKEISPSGLLTRIDNRIQSLSNLAEDVARDVARSAKRMAEFEEVAAQPFRQEAELAEKKDRLQKVTAELVEWSKREAAEAASRSATPRIRDESGPVNFSKAPRITGKPLAPEPLQAAVRRMTARWRNAPIVTVVATEAELPMHVRRSPGYDNTVEAAHETGAIYLIANRFDSLERAMAVLAHEATGHFAVEQMLGEAAFAQVQKQVIALRDAGRMPELFAEVRARYGDVDAKTFAAESIAVMAEKGMRNTIIGRVIAGVRAWLRSVGLVSEFTDGDLRQIITDAGKWLQGARAPSARVAVTPGVSFSKMAPAEAMAEIEGAAKLQLRIPNVLQALSDKFADWKPALLGALTLGQLADVTSRYMPGVKAYNAIVKRMETRRNQLMEGAGEIAKRWEKFQRANRAAARAMAGLMHDATIAGTDPAVKFVPGTVTLQSGEIVPMEEMAVAKAIDRLRADMTLRPKRELSRIDYEIQKLQDTLANEKNRVAEHKRLAPIWEALPQEAKEIYVAARDAYASRADDMLAALIARIGVTITKEDEKKELVARMRAHFESARVMAPYFPLARFGSFWIAGERTRDDGSKVKEFHMAETAREFRQLEQRLRLGGLDITGKGKKLETAKAQDGASGSFVAEALDVMSAGGVRESVRDEFYQLYLRTLPDLSVRKQFIHRKKTAGYAADALRAFAGQMHHGAHQLARLEYSQQLEKAMSGMQKTAKALADAADPDDATRAADVYNEMLKRHDWVINPKDAGWVQALSSANFLFYLGVSPAAALVNMTQTAVTTLPALAARYGWAKAMGELNRAVWASIRTGGDIGKTLTDPMEQAAFKALVDMGAIDRTGAHDLAGIGDSNTEGYNPHMRWVMEKTAWGFHKAEVVNREGSGMAAYRLAREAGVDHEQAIEYAAETIFNTHFDYSNSNRARWMQGNTAKVLFAFKQYSQNMTYLLWRNFYQSMKGATPQQRSEARKKLAGTLGMTALFSGVMGLPTMTLMFSIANAMAAIFGDDDEPWDAETEFRNFLVDFFGDDVGRLAQFGAVQGGLGALGLPAPALADRLKLDQLWFRPADKELEGRAQASYVLEQIGGPIAGMAINTLFVAPSLAAEGEFQRAAEAATPKAVRDLIKLHRYATEGVNNLRGDALVSDPTAFELVMQGAGFSPARVSEQYTVNSALRRYEDALTKRRASLLDAYALAERIRDSEALRAANAKITAFNAANPELAITRNTIRRSLQSRQSYSDRMVNGLVLGKHVDAQARAAVRFGSDDES